MQTRTLTYTEEQRDALVQRCVDAEWQRQRIYNHGVNKAITGAFRKCALAAFTGDRCPYDDRRTRHGAITYSRAFLRAWHDGNIAAKARMHELDEKPPCDGCGDAGACEPGEGE